MKSWGNLSSKSAVLGALAQLMETAAFYAHILLLNIALL